jgi:hypothetical protein
MVQSVVTGKAEPGKALGRLADKTKSLSGH